MSLSCFKKANIGDIIHFEAMLNREYLVISPFDGYKVKTVNMETFRLDDVCVADVRFITKIAKHSHLPR